ncbi:Major facilitator superfamily domain-containing protein 3 [Mactra antiquata]
MISANVAFLAFLYFLQGIPYGLQSRYLPLYFRSHGMSLSNIGFFKLLYIPWVTKALWAPLVDHYGTKKIWLSYSMLGLFVISLLGLLISPENLAQLAFVLLLYNIFTATQDIAVDGLAIQILASSELASGNIAQVVGYKFGALFSGGFMTWIQDLSWTTLFLGLVLVYLGAYFIVKSSVPDSEQRETNVLGTKSDSDRVTGHELSLDNVKEKLKSEDEHWIKKHIRLTLSSYTTRWTLIYVLIYKLGEQGALTMLPLYLVDKGILSASIGFWTGLIGQGVSILGSFLGGWLVSWFGFSPYKILLGLTTLRPFILLIFVLINFLWPEVATDTDGSSQFYYGWVVIGFLILLLESGIVTTTTFTLMMYCSQRSPSAIQASHYTTMATVEVLGKLSFSIVIGQFTEIFGYSLTFTLFVILAKKKQRKDPMMKKSKNDPNAPPNNRIPLPELKDHDKMERINSYREALRRVKMGPNSLPSISFYTFHNAVQGLTSVEISEDSSLLCTGFGDSNIKVWSLTPNKLRSMKQPDELELLDKEGDDVLERMMDNRTAEDTKLLVGHSGAVYSGSFSPDRNYLTSCSEDGSVRLWSLQTWTNLVSYKGHNAPVWDVKFSPQGHYFVSGGQDRVARLWTTDHYQPIRIFAGHFSDVDSVQFHPNGNYIATGSSDRSVRIFDVLNGTCVRTLTGHKGAIYSLCFSPDGKYLASSGLDGIICLWDISNGNMLAQMKDHMCTVYSLCFSRCGAVLASGGLDNCIKLWDVTKVIKDMDKDMDSSIPSSLSVNENPNLLIGSFATKSTAVLNIHFTRKNLLLAAGPMKIS